MKITKRQLRRIIREEKQKIIAENRIRKAVRRKLTENSEDPMYQEVFDLVLMGVLDSYEAEEMEEHDPGSWEYQIERIRDELTDLEPEYETVMAAIEAAKVKARTDYRRGEKENVDALADFEDGVLRY